MSLKYCSDALEISQTPDLYCMRAEAYIANSMFDEGMKKYVLIIFLEHHMSC